MDNYIDARSNKTNNNLHKTEVQLQIGNPPSKSTLRLGNIVKNQVTPVIPDPENNMEVTMWNCSPELRNYLDKEATDDQTSGKSVSALINQFNKVNSSHRTLSDGDSKIPIKKVRTDFQTVVKEKAQELPAAADVVSHRHDAGTRDRIQTEIINQPFIRFTFKVNTAQLGHAESPKHDSLVDGLSRVSVARPLIKLRSFKGSVTQDTVTPGNITPNNVTQDSVTPCGLATDNVTQDAVAWEDVTMDTLAQNNVKLDRITITTANHSPNFTRNLPEPKIYKASETPLADKHNNKPSGDGHPHDLPTKSPALTSHTSPETPPLPNYAPDLHTYSVHLNDQVKTGDLTDHDVSRGFKQVINLSSDAKGQFDEVAGETRTKKTSSNSGRTQRVEITNQRPAESDRKLIVDKPTSEFPSASKPGDLKLDQVSESSRVRESMPRDHSYLKSDSERGAMKAGHICVVPDRSLAERSQVSRSIDCNAVYCGDGERSCVLGSAHCKTGHELHSVRCSNSDGMKRLDSEGCSGSKDDLKSFNLDTQYAPGSDGVGSKDDLQPHDYNRIHASHCDGMKLLDCDRKYAPRCDGCSSSKNGIKSLNPNTESSAHCDRMKMLDCEREHAPQFGDCCRGKDVLNSVDSDSEYTPHEKSCRVNKNGMNSLDSNTKYAPHEDGRCGSKDGLVSDYTTVSGRINDKLNLLKTELMAIREMDLALLRQLISISQTIQRIQRSDTPKVSKSLSFLNRTRSLQYRYRPVQRQNSAPHCPDRMRFMFSNLRSATEEDLRDSLSSFDESEMDSQSELDESTTSLNIIVPNSPRSTANRRKMFRSRDVILSLETSSDADEDYEDILKRNVRLWKLSSQIHKSFQEEIAVWY